MDYVEQNRIFLAQIQCEHCEARADANGAKQTARGGSARGYAASDNIHTVFEFMVRLTTEQLMSTGAYQRKGRKPTVNDRIRRANGTPVRRNWTAWFDPRFEYDRSEINGVPYIWQHIDPEDRRLKGEIERLEQNIASRGLRNPVLVVRKNGVWHLHPGKCRAQAVKNLGIPVIPAIFVVMRPNIAIPEGMHEIRSAEQVKELFEGDIAPEVTHRGIRTPKSR